MTGAFSLSGLPDFKIYMQVVNEGLIGGWVFLLWNLPWDGFWRDCLHFCVWSCWFRIRIEGGREIAFSKFAAFEKTDLGSSLVSMFTTPHILRPKKIAL